MILLFSNDFIKNIAKGYWPVLTGSGSVVFLGDKREKGGIDGR